MTACSRKPIDPTIPEALQDSKSNSEYSFQLKSRESNDLVGELFAEILEKRPEVKKIVDEQSQMLEDIQQNINDLHRSDEKSSAYYTSAKSHAKAIMDSISIDAMLGKIDASEARWKASLAGRDALSAQLQQQSYNLKDELQRLKIRLTMPQIEDYQRKNHPNLDAAYATLKQASKLATGMQAIPEK